MTFRTFLSKLNWRQMLVHFVAMWFFIHAFQFLSYLTNIRLYEAVQTSSKNNGRFSTANFSAAELVSYLYYTTTSWFFALLLALIISLLMSKWKKWFWLNSLISFLIAYLLERFDYSGWYYLKHIFFLPGSVFKHTSYYPTFYLLTNGAVLLSLGVVTFFNNRITRFVDENREKKKKSTNNLQ